MKKSLILIPLMAALLCGCGGNGGESSSSTGHSSSSSSSSAPVGGAVVYDFSSLTGDGAKLDDPDMFKGCVKSGSNVIDSYVSTNVYNGNGSGGAYANKTGLIKFGKSSENGELTLTLSRKVSKVTINVSDFYKDEGKGYPANYILVNGDRKDCPYNASATPADLVWNVSATDSIKISSANPDSAKGGRFVVFKLTLE